MTTDDATATDVHPERARLEALAVFGEKRLARAVVKARAASAELAAAERDLDAYVRRLTDWIAANPDPQLPLPLAAGTPKGATP